MKSILLHIHDDTGLESRLQAAFDLARAFEGHVTCLHATPFEDYLAVDPLVVANLPEEFSAKMRRLRLELQERVERRLRAEGLSWDWVHKDELPSTALIQFSALADVIVVSLAGPAIYRDEPRAIGARVAIRARAPVLAVPEGLRRLDTDAPVLVAWNGSPEAAAAMRMALPLLRLASDVHLVEVEEDVARYPRDMGARYLSRHGVEPQILQQPARGGVAETIRRTAEELGAGMIVMGAYGHSRLRELLLGGVTRNLVGASDIPLLLAH